MFPQGEQKKGILYALTAFGIWGFFPVYFKAVGHVAPLEIVCHRIIWSVPLTALLITIGRAWPVLRAGLKSRRVIGTLLTSALLVAANWYVFIYAVSTGRVLEASLGYYINPLINVLLGLLLLRERLNPRQLLAVLFAAAGTLNLAVQHGSVPWISLTLALSFGLYGFLRKTVAIDALSGLFVETSLLGPLAAGYVIWLGYQGTVAFGAIDGRTTGLLLLAGVLNSTPLLAFTGAARRLPYSTVGLCQYLTPTLHFSLAVFAYQESFTTAHLVTFGFIWTGLAIFITDSLAHQRMH